MKKTMDIPHRQISALIPFELYTKIRDEKLTFSSLIIRGYQAVHNFPAMLARQNELEEKVDKFRTALETSLRELENLKKAQKNG